MVGKNMPFRGMVKRDGLSFYKYPCINIFLQTGEQVHVRVPRRNECHPQQKLSQECGLFMNQVGVS